MDNYASCDPTTIATMKAYVVDGSLNQIHKHKHRNAHSTNKSAQTKPQAHRHKPEREGAKLVAA